MDAPEFGNAVLPPALPLFDTNEEDNGITTRVPSRLIAAPTTPTAAEGNTNLSAPPVATSSEVDHVPQQIPSSADDPGEHFR